VNLIFVDTETTGLGVHGNPPREDGVLEVGLAWEEDGLLRSWQCRCNPGDHPWKDGRADQALQVNGITAAEIAQAPSVTTVAAYARTTIRRIAKGGMFTLVAFNAPFDRSFLETPDWALGATAWRDAKERARRVSGATRRHLSLRAACEKLGVNVEDLRAHSAAGAAEATRRLWVRMYEVELDLFRAACVAGPDHPLRPGGAAVEVPEEVPPGLPVGAVSPAQGPGPLHGGGDVPAVRRGVGPGAGRNCAD
jgi:DNA polymerase III epsilon subunit-like protein